MYEGRLKNLQFFKDVVRHENAQHALEQEIKSFQDEQRRLKLDKAHDVISLAVNGSARFALMYASLQCYKNSLIALHNDDYGRVIVFGALGFVDAYQAFNMDPLMKYRFSKRDKIIGGH